MEPTLLCQMFFGLGTVVSIGGTLIPSFRQQIMNYGSRRTTPSPAKEDHRNTGLLAYISHLQVPHTWFTHNYIVSVLSSIFWGFQIYTQGPAFRLLANYSRDQNGGMTVNQAFLAWLLLLAQGLRRLYESLTLTTPSESTMWAGIWLLGMVIYIVMGISVWIEGAAALSRSRPLEPLDVSLPSMKSSIAVSLFLLVSSIQHACHVHLASLKKYTLPQQALFQKVLCPHYTAECVIYVAIAMVAAPPGRLLNRTVLAGLAFVASNLGVTADSTKKWYKEKFGAPEVAGRWRMVPYLY